MNTVGFSSNEEIFIGIGTITNNINPQFVGLGVSFNELPDNVPQQYEVCVKDPNDWEDIHNYIINENELDGIPNRRIDCISDMSCSSKRSVYQMSNEEADILRNHPKIKYVEKSSLYNPVNLEKRRFYEQIDPHIDTNRFKIDVENRKDGKTGTALTFTQWGLLRHSKSSNPYPSGTGSVYEDVQYSLTGKNVDIVIMDTGVRWDHPEFLKPGYTSVPTGVSTASVSRVRDILIHGESEYGINWSSHGLVAPGTGSLVGYTTSNVLESSTFNGINGVWHGSHVAGIAAGNQFGWAFESNIWSIACVDRSDIGFSDPSDGFDYIRVWHKNKPINPETGRRNPTILNGSWGFRHFVIINDQTNSIAYPFNVSFRGNNFTRSQALSANNVVPAVFYTKLINILFNGNRYLCFTFSSVDSVSQVKCNELFDDPDCEDVLCVFSAGNLGNKVDEVGGEDYDNTFISSTIFPDFNNRSRNYNRLGTPTASHQGLKDAPIVVASLNNEVNTSIGESRSNFSNIGPGVDIISAGSTVLSVGSDTYQDTYQDPRNSSFYINHLSGTSISAPQVSGILACYAESQPTITRVDARNWIFDQGSIVLPTDTGLFFDTYKDPVGVGSVNYWASPFNLKGAEARILYNPTANNTRPSIKGNNLKLSGRNLKFKHGISSARPGGNYSDPLSIGTVTVSGPSSGTLNSNTNWSVSISGTLTDLSYTWSAGSDATITNGTTASPTISWSTGGTKTVTCTVTSASATDSPQSGSASITLTTTIGTVTVSGPSGATPNSNTSWSASISGDATDLSYTWSAGSDATITNGTTASPTISWSSTGSKTVTCTVTSASATDSPQSGSASISIATQFILDLLIVGGGGGGGGSGDSDSSSRRLAGGGGGAGGVRVINDYGINNGAFTVTIGAGGDGGDSGEGDSGGSTSIFGHTVTGGGGGGGDRNLATSGGADGSGGGGGGQYNSYGTDATAGGTGGTYGNDGGDGIINNGNSGGGGGGAGSAGADAYVDQDDSCFGGDGGSGYDLSNFSSLLSGYVAGGGGGGQGTTGDGASINSTPGSGGSGGGGNGGNTANDGNNATGYGSGGGGAGRSRNNYVGGSGSGGVIYIKYSGSASVLSYTGSMTTTINSGTVIHRITSNGTLTKS